MRIEDVRKVVAENRIVIERVCADLGWGDVDDIEREVEEALDGVTPNGSVRALIRKIARDCVLERYRRERRNARAGAARCSTRPPDVSDLDATQLTLLGFRERGIPLEVVSVEMSMSQASIYRAWARIRDTLTESR